MSAPKLPRIEDLASGSRFKNYRLLERIGYGGQAVIWSAYDEAQHQVSAIRFDQAGDYSEADLRTENEAFERQAKIVAELAHPHILPIYDYGVLERLRFIVMPYLAGGSLREWVVKAPLTVSDSLKVIAQLISALDYLHQRQIVHRDLKSTNILLDCFRNVYLGDFGLARVLSASTQALHTGHGTPPYAPPEQHLSARLTAQSDLYSLGILFYELLAGELPWHGEKSLGLQQIQNPNDMLPNPQQLNPAVPIKLAGVLWSLTAAQPADRPPSALAARQMIQAALPKDLCEEFSEGWLPTGAAGQPFAAPLEAAELLSRGLRNWAAQPAAAYPLDLTRFVMVDAAYQSGSAILPGAAADDDFMLYGAMLYHERPAYWWAKARDSQERLAVCARLLAAGHPAILDSLVTVWSGGDASLQSWAASQPLAVWLPLLKAARHLPTSEPMERVLALVEQIVPAQSAWRKVSFSAEIDEWLGELALGQASYSARALSLIGHVRSERAVEVLLRDTDQQNRMENLTRLSARAGNVPTTVPVSLKGRLLAETLLAQLIYNPGRLLQAYFVGALGAALGFGGHVFWSYRLPDFMDTTRWLVALERGIFLGALAGFGLFLTRVVVHRLTSLRRRIRVPAAIGAGSLALLVAFLGYDVLFLDILPAGWLLPAGCLMLAASFGLSSAWAKPRWLQMALSAAGLTLSLLLTWTGYLSTSMTPLLFYEYSWPWLQIAAAALLVGVLVAISGNWGALDIEAGGS